MHNMALQSTSPSYARPQIREQIPKMAFTRYVFPYLRIALNSFVGARHVYNADAHVVPDDAQLPVQGHQGCSLQGPRVPQVELAVDESVPRVRTLVIHSQLAPVAAVQSVELPVHGDARVAPASNHPVAYWTPRIEFRYIGLTQNLPLGSKPL